jgi:hypothetical protein
LFVVVGSIVQHGDGGVAACIDEVVVVEGGRVVVAVSRVVVDVDIHGLGCVDGLAAVGMVNSGTTFSFGCANMTKWSVCSPNIYKPSLLLFISQAYSPLFKFI